MSGPASSGPAGLRLRRLSARRRRAARRLRDWLGLTAVATTSLALLVVTLFSLIGH